MCVERFACVRVGSEWALLRVLARLGAELEAELERIQDAQLAVTVGGELVHAPAPARACAIERRIGEGCVQPLWRAAFALPLEVVRAPDALFELIGCEGLRLALPAPAPAPAEGPRALGIVATRPRVGGGRAARGSARQRLAALATAVAVTVTATATPATALAGGDGGSGGAPGAGSSGGASAVGGDLTQSAPSTSGASSPAPAQPQASTTTSTQPADPTSTTPPTTSSTQPTTTTSTQPSSPGLAPVTTAPAAPAPGATAPAIPAPVPATPAPVVVAAQIVTGSGHGGGSTVAVKRLFSSRRHARDRAHHGSSGSAPVATPPVTQPPATTPPATQPPATTTPATKPPTGGANKRPAQHSPQPTGERRPGHGSGELASGAAATPAKPRHPVSEPSGGAALSGAPAGAPAEPPVSSLSPAAPGFLAPVAWTGSVAPDPALTGVVENLSGLLANGDRPPSFLIPIYMQAGRRYDVPWEVLAAINAIESDYGRDLNTSSAGAIGWMQFEPSTWRTYGRAVDGHSVPNPYDPRDAIFSAARYLAAAGAAHDVARAVYAYNHADWYVSEVMQRAGAIASHAQYERAVLRRGTFSVYFAINSRRRPTIRYRGGVLSHYDRLIAAANMVSAADFPYVYGGGHEQPARFGPFDCSGSVSYVIQQAGYRVPTTVSGDVPVWKFPAGPGRVTIFYNAWHTFMRIGNRFFGTSGFARPGGGAGWFDVNRLPAGYLTQFREVHVPRLGADSFAPGQSGSSSATPRRRPRKGWPFSQTGGLSSLGSFPAAPARRHAR
ncbi:MAG: lytic murein transglycosylase [Solirubrobacteraceae bacterium]